MPSHLFWFNDEQWAKIAPHLPTNQRGPARKYDRLILSGDLACAGSVALAGPLGGDWPALDDYKRHTLERAGNLAENIRSGCGAFQAAKTGRAG